MTHPGEGDGTTPFGQPSEYDSSPGFAVPGYGAPQPNPAPYQYGAVPAPEQPLVVIGDITCTQNHVITPSGTCPIAGTQWIVTDMSVSTERMSQTGLVLAIVGFFMVCFLSLLFLLMKERRTTGYIQVTVRGGGGFLHVTNIPAFSPVTMGDVSGRVNYARTLAAMA
ncbi:hypothetical protein [Gordonia metallireducens]|uniref:hypothetical protein n=1 Tax=Gordonia metallireducens TaxID=2897779 RepID=UPI001E3D0392|nr:hypothetical protein [Gordonia metallireducens]